MILTNWKCGSRSSLWGRLVFRHFDRPAMKKNIKIKWNNSNYYQLQDDDLRSDFPGSPWRNLGPKCKSNLPWLKEATSWKRDRTIFIKWMIIEVKGKIIINFYFTANLIQFTFLSKRRRRKEVRLLVSTVYLMIEKHKNSTPKGLLLTLHWIPTWKSKTNPKDQH